MSALYQVGAHGLAGVALGALFRLLGQWTSTRETVSEREREHPVERGPVAATGEYGSLQTPPSSQGGVAFDLLREQAAAEIRKSVRSGNWEEARSRLADFATDHQGDPRISSLEQEIKTARDSARDEHMAQLEAAQKVNDPDRVLEIHKFLAPLLEAEVRRRHRGRAVALVPAVDS